MSWVGFSVQFRVDQSVGFKIKCWGFQLPTFVRLLTGRKGQLCSFPQISEDLDVHVSLSSVLVFQAWMKCRNGRIVSVAPCDTNCLDDIKGSFQFIGA